MSEPPPAGARPPSLRITMIRCSTLLLQWGELRLLTDPWFGMQLRGLPCLRRPGLPVTALPPLDGVLVSHLHPDHFEPRAVRRLRPVPRRVILPPGGRARLGRVARPGWEELAPWRSTALGPATVTAVPAPHTLPGPAEINFVVELPGFGPLFFGGDARLDGAVLRRVTDEHGPTRVALLPVGGTRIFGRKTVMDPADAERAADLLGAERVVPIHEGGIWLSVPPASLHPGRARQLAVRFARRGEAARVVVLAEGASATIPPRALWQNRAESPA